VRFKPFPANPVLQKRFQSKFIPMKKIGLLFLAGFLFCCNGGKKANDNLVNQLDSNTTTSANQPKVDKNLVGEVLQSIPSPLEISVLIKQSGIRFNKNVLNSPDNISKYNTNYKKALNLGIYSTDLGYCNIYSQNQEALTYLDAVKEMADGLNIGQFFDITTIRRLATSSRNLDSLLIITQQNYEKINVYLQEQDRSNLSILILTGGWLESLYLTCEVTKTSGNKDLKERIGQQKVILDQLLLLLSYYNNDSTVRSLMTDLTALQKQYEKIKVTYVVRESTMKEIDGILIVQDNSTTTIDVPDEVLQSIYDTVGSLRRKMTE
jgi:hypothetical protein